MRNVMKLMLLLAVAACSSEVDNLVLDSKIVENDIVNEDDMVAPAYIQPGNWSGLPDDWFDIYGEPQSGQISGSYTIVSPVVGVGSVSVNYVIKYEFSEKLLGPRNRALVQINSLTTSMVRNTSKYLVWQDLGSLAGPVNYQLTIDNPMHMIYLTLYGKLYGEGGFLDPYSSETNETIRHYANFNINNY